MTPAEIDAIEAQAAAATPGPWEVRDNDDEGRGVSTVPTLAQAGRSDDLVCLGTDGRFSDLDFIAAARTNIPNLCASLRVTQAALDAAALDAGVRSQGVQADLRTAMRRAIDRLRYWRELPVGDGGITEARSAFDILRAALEVTQRGSNG